MAILFYTLTQLKNIHSKGRNIEWNIILAVLISQIMANIVEMQSLIHELWTTFTNLVHFQVRNDVES